MLLVLIIWAGIGAWAWSRVGPKVTILWFILSCVWLCAFAPTAHAGVDNPAKFDGVHVVQRCPKITNPIECRDRTSDDTDRYGAIQSSGGHHVPGVDKCTLNRDLYEYHHGLTGKPDALRVYRGCRLFSLDAAYHRDVDRLDMPDTLQEASERVLASMGVAVSDLGHIALTPAPRSR